MFQDTFVPEEVVHRNTELTHLSGILTPALQGEPAETAAIFGPTGVGKTCCARYAVEQLRENSFHVRTQYVNCWQDYNRYRELYRLLEGLDRTLDIHRQSTPWDVLYDRIRGANEDPYVVVLDEVDQLEEKDVLYDLYTLPHITMILVANDEQEFYSNLGDRLYSRLTGSERVLFESYSLTEIVAILNARANSGLAEGAVSQEQLELIADQAAGDARVAIGILRTAARKADRDDANRLTTNSLKQPFQKPGQHFDRKRSTSFPTINKYSTKSSKNTTRLHRERPTKSTSNAVTIPNPDGVFGTTSGKWNTTT